MATQRCISVWFTRSSLVLAALCGAGPASAQLVTGKVIEEGTDRPVAGAEVELVDSLGVRRASVVADTSGAFRVTAPLPGIYRLRVGHIAYAPMETQSVHAAANVEIEIELRLSPTAVALEPLRVVGRSTYNAGWLQEYYDRASVTRRTGIGRVFFRDDVERENTPLASGFLMYMMPRGGCRPTLFVDGLEVEDARHLNMVMQPDMLEGVELYNNAAFLPYKYANRGHCAVALFWTRRDIPGAKPFTWKRLFVATGILSGIILLFQM